MGEDRAIFLVGLHVEPPMTAIPMSLCSVPAFLGGKGDNSHHPRMMHAQAPSARGAAATRSPNQVWEHCVSDRTDESLIADYVAGDRSALREIIERYRDDLVHFLTRFLGSRAAADDVFQETFLQVHLSAETFDTSRRLKPWLFTLAANKGRDYHRKYSKRVPVSLSATVKSDSGGQSFVDLMEADIPSPDTPVLDKERGQLVRQVVDSLPTHLREILLLSYFQRMSYNQIADTLEIPLGTVKSRLHTAVATFARAWSAKHVDEDAQREERA